MFWGWSFLGYLHEELTKKSIEPSWTTQTGWPACTPTDYHRFDWWLQKARLFSTCMRSGLQSLFVRLHPRSPASFVGLAGSNSILGLRKVLYFRSTPTYSPGSVQRRLAVRLEYLDPIWPQSEIHHSVLRCSLSVLALCCPGDFRLPHQSVVQVQCAVQINPICSFSHDKQAFA